MRELSNKAISRVPKDLLIVLLVLTTSSLAFGLGMLTERERAGEGGTGFWIETLPTSTTTLPAAAAAGSVAGASTAQEKAPTDSAGSANLPYVASRNGETYYLASCKSSQRIKEENRVWFATEADAKASGRRPAANCPGL